MLHIKDQLVAEALREVGLPSELQTSIRQTHMKACGAYSLVLSVFTYRYSAHILLSITAEIASRMIDFRNSNPIRDTRRGRLEPESRDSLILVATPLQYEEVEHLTHLFGGEPQDLAVYFATRACPWCKGSGIDTHGPHDHPAPRVEHCRRCEGNGLDIELSGADEYDDVYW